MTQLLSQGNFQPGGEAELKLRSVNHEHVAKSHGVLGDDLLSLPGGTQPPTEGGHKAQVVPAAAFDLNLLLHISRNMHLQANLEQAE